MGLFSKSYSTVALFAFVTYPSITINCLTTRSATSTSSCCTSIRTIITAAAPSTFVTAHSSFDFGSNNCFNSIIRNKEYQSKTNDITTLFGYRAGGSLSRLITTQTTTTSIASTTTSTGTTSTSSSIPETEVHNIQAQGIGKDQDIFRLGIMTAGAKLEALRTRMKELDIDVYLIPTDDPHLSEYVPKAYMRRAFLTGFTGSAGTAVVTLDKALLWTDSRYWNEAGMQLDAEHWVMQKAGQPLVPTIPKWLADTAAEYYKKELKTLKIGLDPYVHPASFAKDVEKALKEVITAEFDDDDSIVLAELVTKHENLVDPIWGEDRPAIPTSPFRVHPVEYAGKSVIEKIESIRKEMETKHATMSVFSTLDDVAYLFNIRAKGDIDTCPVGIAYASLTRTDCTLYCDPQKLVSDDVKIHLDSSGVTIKPYNDIVSDMKNHCESTDDEKKKRKVWLDKSRSNLALASVVPESAILDVQNAITPMKAAKNNAEIEGMREAHIVDGAAMAYFMAWLEDEIINKGRAVDEVEIDEVLTSYRAQQPGFVECSFPTIAGVGPNGAIIHYRAKRDEIMRSLDRTAPILLDSGAQYTYGTTDVTRTWSFQETPDPKFVEYYTRVLKGHIGVDQMIFPESTPGFVLDVFARRFLWNIGKDYGHGTGHGVGAALNVHEGPISISPRFANTEGLKKGMVVSNEPGFYEDGVFGVRIENLLEIQFVNPDHDKENADTTNVNGNEATTKVSNEKKFLKFGRLTQIPIQKNLIDTTIMTNEELDWLDSYHDEVLAKVGPRLEEDSAALKWLQKSCEKIDRSTR